jgi:hypothetical protein
MISLKKSIPLSIQLKLYGIHVRFSQSLGVEAGEHLVDGTASVRANRKSTEDFGTGIRPK